MSGYRVERVETGEALSGLEGEWRDLALRTPARLPFATFDWASSWWAHFQEQRSVLNDSLFVRAIRDSSGALVAVAPLMLTSRPAVGPVRVRSLQFFGADPNLTEVRGLVCAPGHREQAIHALLADLQATSDAWDWIQWSGIPKDGPEAAAISDLRPVEWTKEIPSFVLPMAPSWDLLRASLNRNVKESLRKCYNSLKREGLEFTFDVVTGGEALAPAVEDVLRLHRERADSDTAVRHMNAFESAAARRFLQDVCARLATPGATRVFRLRINGALVATRIGFVIEDSLYLYYSGYDPAFGKYSVMTTTVAEAIKYAIGQGLKTVNLSTGTDVSKTRWGPQEHVYLEGYQLSPAPRAKVAWNAFRYAMRAHRNLTVQRLARRFMGRRMETGS